MSAKIIQRNRGLTLIELLIVISIIGVLSSVILASLTQARIKGRNTARNQINLEYVKATELFRSQYGVYPNIGNIDSFDLKCIGTWASTCIGGFSPDNTLNTALAEFIPGPPTNNQPSIPDDANGTAYGCSEVGATCTNYELWWFLEGDNRSCGQGNPRTSPPNYTLCKYRSSGNYTY